MTDNLDLFHVYLVPERMHVSPGQKHPALSLGDTAQSSYLVPMWQLCNKK